MCDERDGTMSGDLWSLSVADAGRAVLVLNNACEVARHNGDEFDHVRLHRIFMAFNAALSHAAERGERAVLVIEPDVR
jgi:hypothetical protein